MTAFQIVSNFIHTVTTDVNLGKTLEKVHTVIKYVIYQLVVHCYRLIAVICKTILLPLQAIILYGLLNRMDYFSQVEKILRRSDAVMHTQCMGVDHYLFSKFIYFRIKCYSN